jgi:hypothetical protein
MAGTAATSRRRELRAGDGETGVAEDDTGAPEIG